MKIIKFNKTKIIASTVFVYLLLGISINSAKGQEVAVDKIREKEKLHVVLPEIKGSHDYGCDDGYLIYYVPKWIYKNEPFLTAFSKEKAPYSSYPLRSTFGYTGIGVACGNESKRNTLGLLTLRNSNTCWGLKMFGSIIKDKDKTSWKSISDLANITNKNVFEKVYPYSDCITEISLDRKIKEVGTFALNLYAFFDMYIGFRSYLSFTSSFLFVIEPTFTTTYDNICSDYETIPIFNFLDDKALINPNAYSSYYHYVSHRDYIKNEVPPKDFGVRCSESNCLTNSGISLSFDPSKVHFSDDENKKEVSLYFTLYGVTYEKKITINRSLTNLNSLVAYEEYKVKASEQTASWQINSYNGSKDYVGNLKKLITSQLRKGNASLYDAFEDNIDCYFATVFPGWKDSVYWDFGETKTIEGSIELRGGRCHSGNNKLEKKIKITMEEDRFDLKKKIPSQESVLWNEDGTRFTLKICIGSYNGNYRLQDLFSSDFQNGKFEYVSAINLDKQALKGDGSSNARIETKKVGKMTIKYVLNAQNIEFDVEILSKPSITVKFFDAYCDKQEFLLKDKIVLSPDYVKIDKLIVDGEEKNYESYRFNTNSSSATMHNIKLSASTGYECNASINKNIYVNSKEVSFKENTLLLCSASPPINFAQELENATISNGTFHKDNVPFSGVFLPNSEPSGTYEILYSEQTDNFCKKEARMTIQLETTPSIDKIVKDKYVVQLGDLAQYNKTTLLSYLSDKVGNGYISFSMASAFPSGLNNYLTDGKEISLSLTASMDKAISPSCVHSNESKGVTIILKENRFDLSKQLTTTRIKKRGDKLVLCKDNQNDYRLSNLFKEGYREGTYTCTYTDSDNDPNNDEDPIIINNDILLLNRSVNANIDYQVTKNGFTNHFNFLVEVVGVDFSDIRISSVPDVCFSKPIDLKPYVFPQKGIFESSYTFKDENAITADGILIPSLAGKGIHEITYTLGKDACTKSKRFRLVINDLLPTHLGWLDEIPAVCENASPINLRNYVNTDKGSFVGKGVGGDMFDPSIAGSGLAQVNFVFQNENDQSGCRLVLPKTINVLPKPKVRFANIPVQCYRDSMVDIRKYFSPKGGIFEGIGITNNEGFFKADQAGIGEHEIIYTYVDTNHCKVTLNAKINVDALIEKNRLIDSLPVLCKDSKSIFLPDFVQLHLPNSTTQTSSFSGRGVNNDNYFNPQSVSIGKHDIIYTVLEGRCKHQSIKEIKVDRNVGFHFKDLPVLCTKEALNLDNYVNIKGGNFFGRGIEKNFFYPEKVGEGVYVIDYKYQFENSCLVSDYKYLTVRSLSAIDFTVENDNTTIRDGDWIKISPVLSEEKENPLAPEKKMDYYWSFSDGDYSYQQEVYKYFYLNWEYVGWNEQYKMNEYKMVGDNTFDVSLHITQEGCTKHIEKKNHITVLPVENEFLTRDVKNGTLKKAKVLNKQLLFSDIIDKQAVSKIWHHKNTLYLENIELSGNIEVYDVLGRKIRSILPIAIKEKEQNFFLPLQKGIYLLKINEKTYKIYADE